MVLDTINIIKEHYEKGYKKKGASFQRKYPNEELCRFMGRNFFSIPKSKRKKIKILEKEIYKISKKEFKIGSTKQLGEIMYNELKIASLKKTKKGSC